jgi:hypothetical protein
MEQKTAKPKRVTFGGKQEYVVVGTAYGYLRNIHGDIRTWKTYSGAAKAAKKYVPF